MIATQNPARQVGTFPLPESQLDRFLIRVEIGYPDAQSERDLLKGADRRQVLASLEPAMTPKMLLDAQVAVPSVHVSDALVDYLQGLLAYTRESSDFETGLSPRAGIALIRAAQSWALMHARGHVLPEDLQRVFAAVVGHRLAGSGDAQGAGPQDLANHLLHAVPIP